MNKLLSITRDEFNRLRVCELDNHHYTALVRAFEVRTGGTGRAEQVIRKHWRDTLRQFDNNSFLSIYEVFNVM